jgi:3-phosphoshikimate 1-carboxyvinyltransferase
MNETEVTIETETVSTPVTEPVESAPIDQNEADMKSPKANESRTGTLEIHRAKKLRGTLSFPGDAHQALLACGIAALCEESVRIGNLPAAPWFAEYRAALEALGVLFEATDDDHVLVRGGSLLKTPDERLVVRHELAALILAGLCGGRELGATLELDPVLVPRDIETLLRALYPQGEDAPEGFLKPGALNPKARGLVKPWERKWDDGFAKVALLFHHLAAGESLELHLRRQGSDLLENMLRHFEVDLKVERDDDKDADELTRRIARQMRAAGKDIPVTRVKLPAGARPRPVFLALAGDVTEASVAMLAATLVKGSDVLLENVLLNTGRGGFPAALRRMGADIEVMQRREPRQGGGEAQGTLRVRTSEIFAKRFDADTLADLRDEIFLLLAAATFAEGETVFRNLDWLRLGPVDFLREFTAALKRGGVETGEIEDGLVIRGRGESDGGAFDSLGHPGLAAAWAVIALKSHGASSLAGAEALERRHPGLLHRLAALESQAGSQPAEKTP